MATKKKNSKWAQNDANFVTHPDLWPKWPYLPIKRWVKDEKGREDMECGIILGTETPWSRVFVANIWHLPPTREEFLKTEKYQYPTVEALLADGWVVD